MSEDIARDPAAVPGVRSTIRFAPLALLLCWLLATVLLFAFGPYEYAVASPLRFWTFLAAVHVALISGFVRGARSQGRVYRGACSPLLLAKVALAVTVIAKTLELIATRGGDLRRIALTLTDPAQAYISSSVLGAPTLFSYLSIGVAPFFALSVILGTYYWRSLPAAARAAVILLVLLTVLSALGAAVRGVLVALGVFGASGLAAAHVTGRLRLSRRQLRVVALTGALLVVAFFKYFAYLAENRAGLETDVLFNPLTFEQPNLDAGFYRVLPDSWHTPATVVAFYVSHAYYRLGQAMELPSAGPGFGAAHSIFLVRNVVRLSGWSGFEDRSYGYRLDKNTGYGGIGQFWVTFYAWIASDVTYPGVVVVVFLIGYLLSLAWSDVLLKRNPLAVPAFAALCFIVYEFPLTNPLQDGPGLATFGGLPLVWLITRSRRRDAIADG